jgi:hypothetical protein
MYQIRFPKLYRSTKQYKSYGPQLLVKEYKSDETTIKMKKKEREDDDDRDEGL